MKSPVTHGTIRVLLAVLSGAAASAAAGTAESDLERELLGRARATLQQHLGPDDRRAPAEVAVKLVGGRGAASSPCAAGWTLGAVNFSSFGRVVVPVTCGAADGSFVARLTVRAPVHVLKDARPVGHLLQEGDLGSELREVRSLSEIVPSRELLSLRLRRALTPGTALRREHVERPVIVRRGDAVPIVATLDGVSVSAPGVALSPGRAGDTIEVRNTRSSWIVQGRLSPSGSVEAISASPPRPGRAAP